MKWVKNLLLGCCIGQGLIFNAPKVQAQFVPVSDPVFASALCTRVPALMSMDCLSLDTLAAAAYSGTLQLQNFGFTNVQELVYFKSINFLQITNNNVLHLPNLSGLTLLTAIDVRGNPWSDFAELEPIKNQLTKIEFRRSAGGASVKDLTYLGTFPNLTSIEVTNFNVEVLPDFSIYPGLTLLGLRGNLLTYKDLLPLTTLPSYASILDVMPQAKLTKNQSLTMTCHKAFALSTTIDNEVGGITYDFFKDSVLIQSSSSSSYLIEKPGPQDEGAYYIQIRNNHPYFVPYFLTTGLFTLKYIESHQCKDLFTPNQDGIDDELYLEGEGEALIRNKLGTLIKTIPLPAYWDGRDANGKEAEMGLYSISIGTEVRTVTLMR